MKLAGDHEGTYINMQRLIEVQGARVVTGVPAQYILRLLDEIGVLKARVDTLEGMLAEAHRVERLAMGTVERLRTERSS